MIILGYVILILIQVLSIQALPATIIGGLLSRLFNSLFIGALIGSIFTWFLISYLWFKIFGYYLPFLAFILSLLFHIIHINVEQYKLTPESKTMMVAEIWSIIIVGFCVLTFVEFNWV